MNKKTFFVVADLSTSEIAEVVEGFKEQKYDAATMWKLDAKLFLKRNQLLKKYSPEKFILLVARSEDYGSLKKQFASKNLTGWEGIVPRLIDIKINRKMVNEIYEQIPENAKNGFAQQAKTLAITEEKDVKQYVVEIWLMEQRIGEQHESEK